MQVDGLPSKRSAKYPHLQEMLEWAIAVPLSRGLDTTFLRDFSPHERHATMTSTMDTDTRSTGKWGRNIEDLASTVGYAAVNFDPATCAINGTQSMTLAWWGRTVGTSKGMIIAEDESAAEVGVMFGTSTNRITWVVAAGGRTGFDKHVNWTDADDDHGPAGFASTYDTTLGQSVFGYGELQNRDVAQTGDFDAECDKFGMNSLNDGSFAGTGTVEIGYVWARVLSGSDIALLNAKPLAMFERRPKLISLAPVAAAGAGVAKLVGVGGGLVG